ncbi:hypothetical protein B0H13DRAFT_1891545 [Mycena leptocephala]|nr:hypothetical protein B0H13DRAFT_1891545 [Mycena leptocephala]
MGNTEKERSPRFSCRLRGPPIWNGRKICRPIWLPRGFFSTRPHHPLRKPLHFAGGHDRKSRLPQLGVDFPNFDLSSTELEWYGIFPFYKARQIALLSATHFRRRKFGGGLLRYNPSWVKREDTRSPIFRWKGFPRAPTHPNRQKNPRKLDRMQHPYRSWGCYRTGFDERRDCRRRAEIILRLECKIFAYFALGGPSYASPGRGFPINCSTSSKMPQLVIRRPNGPPSAISRNAHILQELSLPLETLDTLGFTPDEPWSEFFEFRLRPMIYLVHAGVTQDFSLIGRKGVYSLGELEEIKHWVQQTLLHCKGSPAGVPRQFQHLLPPTWGIPGEAVAMFEIMYRICLSIGFPCSDDSLCPLDRHVLLPLIMGARETRALLKTTDDYSAYNRFGEVVDADRFIGGLARIIKAGRGSAASSDSESSSSREIHWPEA